jgi:hypothetical protein
MLNTIAKVAQGNPTIITDSSSRRLQKLNIYGQSSQDGTPSVENPIPIISKTVNEIKVTGANLIKYPYHNGTRTVKGVTFTVNDDQSITINGTNDGTGNSEFVIIRPNRFKNGDAISTGLISDKDDANVYVNAYYVGNIGTNSKSENRIIDDDSRNYDIVLTVKPGATIDNVTVKIMRNYGPTLLPYEPYKEQTITLSEPITLRGIPVESGDNVTIDGQQYIADYIDSLTGKVNRLNGYIDSYNGEEVGTIFMSTTGQLTTGAKAVYKLSQPTQEDLPEDIQAQIKALKSYYPNTVIQTGCWNEVTYSAKRGG